MTATTPAPHFAPAAKRHFDDAEFLLQGSRLASADHLAGFAAECSIKAILLRFLNATLDANNKPISVVGTQPVKHGHLPKLWDNLALVAHGRSGAQLAALVTGANPFTQWDVSDRYADGASITLARVEAHLAEAKKVIAIYQSALVTGTLP